jgi:hypothetical protein
MSKKIKIDDVSLPEERLKDGCVSSGDLFEAMKKTAVGQSFVVDGISNANRVHVSIACKWSGCKFRCLKQSDGTVRIGRVK